MRTLARTSNGDLYIQAGQLAISEGKTAQAQIIEAAILTVKGELQYDIKNGIPYFDTIFQNPNKIDIWRAYVIKRVREFPWVSDIVSFDVSYDYKNQSVRYDMKVTTDEGIVTVGGTDRSIMTI